MNQQRYVLLFLLLVFILSIIWWSLGGSFLEHSTDATDPRAESRFSSKSKEPVNQKTGKKGSREKQANEAEKAKRLTSLSPAKQNPVEKTEPLSTQNKIREEGGLTSTFTEVEATPLWQPEDVISSGSGYKSEWVSAANVIAMINLPTNKLRSMEAGAIFSLPVGETPKYKVEKKSKDVNGDINWMAVHIGQDQSSNRYGVITEGKNLLLMTLYTDKGVYYIRSSDKTLAEVSFVDYKTLQQVKLKKERKEENL